MGGRSSASRGKGAPADRPADRRPRSTYRLQLSERFTLHDAAEVVDYLSLLGVDWVYLSPILQSAAHSTHGYDVTDHGSIDAERGGRAGFDEFVRACRRRGLGILIDIVPNHVGVATPSDTAWWWDTLSRGRASRFAEFFDVDWDAAEQRVRLPVLAHPAPGTADRSGPDDTDETGSDGAQDTGPDGAGSDHTRDAGRDAANQTGPDGTDGIILDRGELVAAGRRYPVAPGSSDDGADAQTVHARQHYELVETVRAHADLNYRRFFAVSDLAAIRMESEPVFEAAHREVLRWFRDGLADGLRIDHPDGLADPAGYLRRLATRTDGAYLVVEKILEAGESLPGEWPVAGTTGYDALGDFDRILIDPAGEETLTALDRAEPGQSGGAFEEVAYRARKEAMAELFEPELARLERELGDPPALPGPLLRDALRELIVCFPVYRSYLPHGGQHLLAAARDASARRPELAETISRLVAILGDPGNRAARRFEQTTVIVMAKGIEDRAFYRYNRLGSLTEVGGDPREFSITPAEFDARQERRQAQLPHSMTTLSTHDTKRGEDVRARLDALSELPEEWAALLGRLRQRAPLGDPPMENLLWQAILGSWPAARERLHGYAEKAAREAAESTGWEAPDRGYEDRLHRLVDSAFDDPEVAERIEGFLGRIRAAGWSNGLSAKLLQLAAPGVPDVYQGSELWERSLVDPDNRRDVDFALRRRMLADLDDPAAPLPPIDDTGAAKLLVVSRTLRLRREHPELFTRYRPVEVLGPAAEHAIAFDRGGAIAIGTRLPIGLERRGGWGETELELAGSECLDALTGRVHRGPRLRLAAILESYPVALLVPAGLAQDGAPR